MKRWIQRTLARLGYKLTRIAPPVSPVGSLEACLRRLKAIGFSPGLIYDIGANRGAWTRHVRTVFPDASFLLVEPQLQLAPYVADLLEEDMIRLVNCAVSDSVGEVAFCSNEWDVTSHLSRGMEGEGKDSLIEVDVKTVDILVAEDGGRIPDFIKIDAEGSDLNVLAGSSSTFGITEAFLVEASLCCPDMENDVAAVVSRMKEQGYKLAAVTDINPWQSPPDSYAPGLQWLADLLFLRIDGPLLKALQQSGPGTLVAKW